MILDRQALLKKLNHNTFRALIYVIFSYASVFSLFIVASLMGHLTLPLPAVLSIAVIYWLGLLYCRILITRGYTQKFKDPSLTFVQIAWNFVTHIPLFYFLDHDVRGPLLFLFCIPMAFSFIRLNLIQGIHLALYPIGGYLVVIWLLSKFRPEEMVLHVEGFRIAAFAAITLFMGVFTGYINNLRMLLKEKSRALTQANHELVKAQEQLMTTAHRAGMAEIASEVMHKIGNSLNSLSVSASVVEEQIRNIRIEMLRKLTNLIVEHEANLSKFFAEDRRANMIPEALDRLTGTLESSRDKSLEEMHQLETFIDQMREALTSHLDYTAEDIKLHEWIDVGRMLEEVSALFSDHFQAEEIALHVELEPLPKLKLQRSKFRHVLINMLQNALEELRQLPANMPRKIHLSASMQEKGPVIRISDSGRGIHADVMKKIFQHGFSTKESSLGYGLHYCVGVLHEMDAKILVSNNHAQAKVSGATFEIQFAPVKVAIRD